MHFTALSVMLKNFDICRSAIKLEGTLTTGIIVRPMAKRVEAKAKTLSIRQPPNLSLSYIT